MTTRMDIRKARIEARVLADAARELEQEAQRLSLEANRCKDHIKKMEHWLSFPARLDDVRRRIDEGYPEADAITMVAEASGFLPMHLAHHLHDEERKKIGARHWRRDREIMRLAWAGKTNAEISGKVKLRPKSVSRIIAGKLRTGRALVPPEIKTKGEYDERMAAIYGPAGPPRIGFYEGD